MFVQSGGVQIKPVADVHVVVPHWHEALLAVKPSILLQDETLVVVAEQVLSVRQY